MLPTVAIESSHLIVGWYRHPKGLLRMKNLKPSDKFLVSGLLEWWVDKGQPEWFWASNRQLAAFCGISEPSLIKSRQRLIQLDWISVKIGVPRKKQQQRLASCYRINQNLRDTISNNPLPLNTSTLVVAKVL